MIFDTSNAAVRLISIVAVAFADNWLFLIFYFNQPLGDKFF